MKRPEFRQARVSVALAALWLAACGGGGGSDTPATPVPPPVASGPATPAPPAGAGPAAPAPAPTPAPTPAPAPVTGNVSVTADTQMAANGSYTVNATTTTPVTLTLPPTAPADATVTVTGASATPWVIAQNAGQSIVTKGLAGSPAPGTVWTPQLTPKVWHWISSNDTGEVLLAGEAAGGRLNASVDGGLTWTSGNSPTGVWISSDMTATGSKMVAVQYQGGMYTSTDFGVTWTRVTAPLVNPAVGVLAFESVTISQDGQRMAAVVQPSAPDAANPTAASVPNGRLVVSTDGGTTWTEPALPGGAVRHAWRNVDSSADGATIVAVAEEGEMFLSTDAGATWTAINVHVVNSIPNNPAATTVITENWYRVKLSGDGQTIVVAANTYSGAPGTGVWVSRDRGTTWTRTFTATADYTQLAVSANGANIAATASNLRSTAGAVTSPGFVIFSTDSGATFQRLTMPGTDTDWRAIAMSADGVKLAAATGKFDATPPAVGQLYTSLGDRTSLGTRGSISAGQNSRVTLRSLGTGQWVVQGNAGGPFTIH